MELQFKNVTKDYGDVHAVDHVTYSMEKGVYGLLGVNGAGKSTLMRMLCTAINPTSGEILWNGKDIFSLGASYRGILGYLPQNYGFYPDLSVYDYMTVSYTHLDVYKRQVHRHLPVIRQRCG